VLVALLFGRRRGRAGLARVRQSLRAGELRPWHCLGGLCGAYFVVAQGVTVGALGVAFFTVAVVAGQSASGLAVDRVGVGPAGPQPLTVARGVGAVLSVVAVLVASADELGNARLLGLAVLPATAGIGVAWQQAVNGKVRGVAVAALPAAFVNFLAGTVALFLAFAIDLLVRGAPSGTLPTNPVLYVGGLIGIAFIAVSASIVRHTGVLLLTVGMIAGQLLGALTIDLIAPAGGGPSPLTVLGTALTLLAVVITALPWQTVRTALTRRSPREA
jgi:transporter family-2 protein